MKAKLYQATPYNIIDNNFYNFKSEIKFKKFLDKIEKAIVKEVSIVKLEAYNKIMYKLQFNNDQEEKTFCGFKYMIVDNKYWFITNFEVKKNNNSGFVTYYAQLDHWATQWLTVKNHLHNNIKEKSLYVERMHQNRWNLIDDKLYINFNENSPFHQNEKININYYVPDKEIILKSKKFDYNKDLPMINKSSKAYYFLRWQLKKPTVFTGTNEKENDFSNNYIFIFLNNSNFNHYLPNFDPDYMNVFSTIDAKFFHVRKFFKNTSWFNKLAGNFLPREDDLFVTDLDFYKSNVNTDTYDTIKIENINSNFNSINFNYIKSIENELILENYPYKKYYFLKGNNMKEYKINDLLFYTIKPVEEIIMKYISFISFNIYNLWIYPNCGVFYNKNNFITYGLNITNNLEIPMTSNSYTTYAQSNLNSLQTNINQAEQTRQIANQEASIGLITSAVTTALGIALAPVTFGTSLGLAASGVAYMGLQTNKWVNNQIRNNFEVDSLNAKINDMKNNPNTISTINNDYYWLTYFNNSGFFDNKIDYSISKFLISSISYSDKNILFDWYYYNGYLFNRYTNNLHFDEYRNRYLLNFYKIKDLKTLLATCPEICNEDIEWWNNTFAQGIIVWETEDPLQLYDKQIYIGNNKYENWETELLQEKYILEKIKEDRNSLYIDKIINLINKERSIKEEKELISLLLKIRISDEISRKIREKEEQELLKKGFEKKDIIKYQFYHAAIKSIEKDLKNFLKNPEKDPNNYSIMIKDIKILELKEKLEKIDPNERIFESKSKQGFVFEGIPLKVFYIIWRNNINDQWKLVKYQNEVTTKDIKLDQYNTNSLYITEGNNGKSSLIIKDNNKIVHNFYEEKTEDYFKVYIYNGDIEEAPILNVNEKGNLSLYDIEITI